LSLESTSTRMIRLGRSELNIGYYIPTAEVTARIDAVTKEQVDAEARRLFAPQRLALTVLGSVDVQRIAGAFESLAQSA
jgi:predicted Zn-dependent peptidase